MSHFTKVETKIKDLVCLKKALTDLGYTFTEGEQGVVVKGYMGQTETAELSIHASSKYDVGVKATASGYEFVSDWWGVETTRGWSEEEFLKKVTRKYSYHKVMQEIQDRGYTLDSEEVKEDQTVQIRVRTWS